MAGKGCWLASCGSRMRAARFVPSRKGIQGMLNVEHLVWKRCDDQAVPRLRTNIGNVSTLDDAVSALNPTTRRRGKTIIRVRP